MFDPAALGTLLIGLDAVRHEQDMTIRHRPVRTTRRHRVRPIMSTIASVLRTLADRFDRPASLPTEA